MPRQQGKPKRAMTKEERLEDALEMIVEGNHPYIHDVAGAAYNYGIQQVKELLADALEKKQVNVDAILKQVDELKFTTFYSTRQ